MTAAIGIEYYQLKPTNHFKSVPVVSSGKSTGKTSTNQQSNKKQSTNPKDLAFNVLIMGSDARPGDKIGHSDSMLLAHVDLGKNQINVVSIPRDTRVYLDGYGYTKLTSVQYILQATKGPKQGIEGAVNAISKLTGVPINYYAETNFDGLQSMVDAVGGINLDVPETIKINNQVFQAGNHFVNGKTALAIARERHSAADGDYARQMAQLEVLKGIGKRALSPSNISKLPSLVKSINKFMIGTNMSTSDMVSLGLAVKTINPSKQVHYQQIPGTGKVMYDDILKANNDEIVINQQKMKSIIAKNF
ncbi:LCP family protein [Pullulanibacillus sp. KACC 23026]|uniref:LCP family protein n=1 Tax=Pullulanibacillus sp. KACC 23026 TaxID=3028315 RepID=UPI0023B043D2|nr:LCP family protein [Pullulanibacillus sp. KACC 23026]WEG13409.1 LCP family protein [Pullulanibacillus sp. KACC 23026]